MNMKFQLKSIKIKNLILKIKILESKGVTLFKVVYFIVIKLMNYNIFII